MAIIDTKFHEPEAWTRNKQIIQDAMNNLLAEGYQAIRPDELSKYCELNYTMFHFMPLLTALQDMNVLVLLVVRRETQHQHILVMLRHVFDSEYVNAHEIPESRIINLRGADGD